MNAPRDPFHLVGGKIAGEYVASEVVGENAYAVVYRCTHLSTGALAAVKVFKALGEFSTEQRESLLRSLVEDSVLVRRVAQLDPSVCAPLEIGPLTLRDGNWVPYVAFEWLDGASLSQIREEEQYYGLPPRSLEAAMALLEPAAVALARAHELHLVHAGLTPSSVFVLGDPRASDVALRLLDFGVARAISTARSAGTPSGVFTMTPSYYHPEFAAPEQVDSTGHPIAAATDVYSLALVIAHLLAYPPDHAKRDTAFFRGTPMERGVSIPAGVEAVFVRALARDPAERPRNAAELWNALRTARGLAPLTIPRAAPRPPPSQPDDDAGATLRISHPEIEVDGSAPADETVEMADPTADETLVERARPHAPLALPSAPPPPRSGAPVLIGALVGAAAVAGAAVWLRQHPPGSAAKSSQMPSAPDASSSATSPAASPAAAADSDTASAAANSDSAASAGCPAGMVEIAAAGELPAFCLDVHEVTVAQYTACSQVGACKRASRRSVEGPNSEGRELLSNECNLTRPTERAEHPINCVTWEMADIYCRAQDKRLPAEAEWERAAGGAGRRYPWGEQPPAAALLNACGDECVAWLREQRLLRVLLPATGLYPGDDDGYPTTSPVGRFAPGATSEGVHDLAGNVAEWIAGDPAANPSTDRVVRGGSWLSHEPAAVEISARATVPGDRTSPRVGFRCARDR